jgi:hypothetical protein
VTREYPLQSKLFYFFVIQFIFLFVFYFQSFFLARSSSEWAKVDIFSIFLFYICVDKKTLFFLTTLIIGTLLMNITSSAPEFTVFFYVFLFFIIFRTLSKIIVFRKFFEIFMLFCIFISVKYIFFFSLIQERSFSFFDYISVIYPSAIITILLFPVIYKISRRIDFYLKIKILTN